MTLFTFLPIWFWLVLSGAFFALGEFLSKEFALKPGWTLFAFILLVDAVSVISWLPAIFEKNQLSITGVLWSLISLLMTVLIGILFFGEKLTLIQFVGVAFGFVSVALLSI